MSKKIRCAALAFALAAVVTSSAALSACTVKSDHPQAKITIEFNNETYTIEYKMYRNMYPQTVQHFIELADLGFYDDMIIHDYQSGDWLTGAYAYNYPENNKVEGQNADGSLLYDAASSGGSASFGTYLESTSKEAKYYEWFNAGKLTPTVYSSFVSKDGKLTVDRENALPTLIGEFTENDHKIEKGALNEKVGCLKMYYYSKGDSNKKAVVQYGSGADQIFERDYKYNSATSVFAMQVGSTSYNASKYCVFAELKNDSERDELDKLTQAIKDYASENGGNFTRSVSTTVDNLDEFAEEGGRSIEVSFAMTTIPIVIKTVKITKY